MIAAPSLPDITSRTAPVWLFVTATLASATTAPDWSLTRTTIEDVFGD
jgi:hypothetical protein